MNCPRCGRDYENLDPDCDMCQKMKDFFTQHGASYSVPETLWPDGDSMDWTIEHALTYALHLLRARKVFSNAEPTKCYIILLNDEDNNYGTREINSGMKRSELVGLLEIMKARVIKDLDAPSEEE